jgi:hypothetical protein
MGDRERVQRYRSGQRPVGRWLATALAVLALVTQTVLFDLAMAAAGTAAILPAAAAPHAHHHPAPANAPAQHEHGKDCPFCVARAGHQATALPAGPAARVAAGYRLASPRPRPQRIRARQRPACFRSRSPPRGSAH